MEAKKDTARARARELDEMAARINAAWREALAARSADADGGAGGVTLHVETPPPPRCAECGGLDRPPDERPAGCPHCIARYF